MVTKKIKKDKNINANKININTCTVQNDKKIRTLYSYIKRNNNKDIVVVIENKTYLNFILELFNNMDINLAKNIYFITKKEISSFNHKIDILILFDYFEINEIKKNQNFNNIIIILNESERDNLKLKFNNLQILNKYLYDIDNKILKLIKSNYFINKLQHDSFMEYVKYYKQKIKINEYDLIDIAKTFYLNAPPKVNII